MKPGDEDIATGTGTSLSMFYYTFYILDTQRSYYFVHQVCHTIHMKGYPSLMIQAAQTPTESVRLFQQEIVEN